METLFADDSSGPRAVVRSLDRFETRDVTDDRRRGAFGALRAIRHDSRSIDEHALLAMPMITIAARALDEADESYERCEVR